VFFELPGHTLAVVPVKGERAFQLVPGLNGAGNAHGREGCLVGHSVLTVASRASTVHERHGPSVEASGNGPRDGYGF
jgi:hypothetical protein